jgi:hypothetical protein
MTASAKEPAPVIVLQAARRYVEFTGGAGALVAKARTRVGARVPVRLAAEFDALDPDVAIVTAE